VFEDTECIFVPISDGWEDKARSHSSPKSRSPHNHSEEVEGALDFSVYNEFNTLLKSSVNFDEDDSKSVILQNKEMSVSHPRHFHQDFESNKLKRDNQVEVKVIFIKSNPIKNKDLVLKVYTDKNNGLMGASPFNNKLPCFIIDTPGLTQSGSIQKDQQKLEAKMVECQYVKWLKDKTFPTAVFNSTINTGDNYEKQILSKQFEIPLEVYTADELSKIKEEFENDIPTVDIDSELESRKDYRDRFVMTIKSEYYENKQITFSIQSENDIENEITIYLPDVERFIRHDSILDHELRNRKRTYKLPYNEVPMLPDFIQQQLSLSESDPRLAIAVTVPIEPGTGAISLSRNPVVERCVIKNTLIYSYVDCQADINYLVKEDSTPVANDQKTNGRL